MKPARYILLLAITLLNLSVLSQENDLFKRLENLKTTIRKSTYYDSAAVFSKGAEAIKLAKELKAPGEVGLIYQYYGSFFYYSNDYKSARRYFNKAIRTAEACNDLKLKNSTQLRLTFMLAETDLLEAESAFNRLLKQAQQHHFIENCIEAYNGLGILYDQRLINDRALDYYYKALRLAEKHHKKYYITYILNNIGLLKHENKQFQDARKDFLRGLKLAKELDDLRLISNLQNNLGLINKELKDYNASIDHYKETIRITHELGFPINIGAAYVNLSSSYALNHEYKQAKLYADSAIAIFSHFEELEYLGRSYLNKANIYAETGDLDVARASLDSVRAFHKRQPSPFNYINSFDIESLIYEKEHDYKQAFELRNRFYAMNDSIEDITDKGKLADLQVLYGKERVESQLSEEKTKNKLLAKDSELKMAQWRFGLFVAIAVFLLILGFFYVRYVQKSRKQQVVFSQKLIEQLDEERSRISKDLHDDIGQSLSVVKSKIHMYNTGHIAAITGLEREVGEVIDQTRTISHQLHPSSLEKLGLERSLAGLIERTQASTGIISSMYYSLSEALPLDVQTQLYRISQECVNNTIKHAHAQALKISLEETDGQFVFQYRDNGVGMASAFPKEGLGFMTIRERINLINGKLFFVSHANKGVQLTVKFR